MKKFVYATFGRSDPIKMAGIAKFVMEQGCTPMNMVIDTEFYPRDNERIIQRADEVWVFGTVDKRMWTEIVLAKKLRKPIRFFIFEDGRIREISEQNARYDEEVREIIIEEKARHRVIPTIRLD